MNGEFPPPRLDFGVRYSRDVMVMSAASLQAATAEVEDLDSPTAMVMVRENFTGEWVPYDWYERFGRSKQDEEENERFRRLHLFYTEQVYALRNEVWRLRLQLNTEWDNIPLKPLRDLPSEWRTMLSLKVEDVARELETIIDRELAKKRVPRTLPEAVVDDSHPLAREVRVKVGRRRHTFRSVDAAAQHLAMAQVALAEFERREMET